MATMKINDVEIGDNANLYFIAEAGVHHYGSVELAKDYIRAAKIAGSSAIKFQTYTADELVTTWAPLYWEDSKYTTQHEIFSDVKGLTKEQYQVLFDYSRDIGIDFLSTAFDVRSARMLNDMGMVAFKIASADITNIPLIKEIALYRKPIILSTGASYFSEIQQAADTVYEVHDDLALLHCSLAYPTKTADANLGRIFRLREAFPEIVLGYSDHTRPIESNLACPLSVALGARIIEKHFTLNANLEGHDHFHSEDQDGFSTLVKNCNDAIAMCPADSQEVTDTELVARENARRSIVAAHDIPKGQIIEESDLAFKRPGSGLSPVLAGTVIGKTAKTDIAKDSLITDKNVY